MKHKFKILYFDTLPSSNDYAKENIEDLQEHTVIWCGLQTRGRGRFDRVWKSRDDLTFTLVFHNETVPALSVPIAVVQALHLFGIEAFIKWPNDIIVNDKKVCGILIEKVYDGSFCTGVIAGIGINICEPDLAYAYKAGHVCVCSNDLCNVILEQYEQLEACSADELLQKYRHVNYLQGRKIMLDDVLWNVEDISEEGYLIVSNNDTSRKLKSEEVTLQQIY